MGNSSRTLTGKLWLVTSVLCIFLSLVGFFLAGSIFGMVNVVCPGRKYVIGLLFMCKSNTSSSDVHDMFNWFIRDLNMCSGLPLYRLPVWIVGSQILVVCGCVTSIFTLIILTCYIRVPASFALSTADGLAAVCFCAAAFQGAALLNLSSGHTTNLNGTIFHEASNEICTVLREDNYMYIMSGIVALLALSGLICLLAQILEGKRHHLRMYEDYMKCLNGNTRKKRNKTKMVVEKKKLNLDVKGVTGHAENAERSPPKRQEIAFTTSIRQSEPESLKNILNVLDFPQIPRTPLNSPESQRKVLNEVLTTTRL